MFFFAFCLKEEGMVSLFLDFPNKDLSCSLAPFFFFPTVGNGDEANRAASPERVGRGRASKEEIEDRCCGICAFHLADSLSTGAKSAELYVDGGRRLGRRGNGCGGCCWP